MGKIIRELERKIMRIAIDSLLAAGYAIGWNRDGYIEDDDSYRCLDSSEATLDEAFACDELRLWVFPDEESWKGKLLAGRGWVYFVFGNDGYDVMNDYTTNLEEVLTPANKFADQYA